MFEALVDLGSDVDAPALAGNEGVALDVGEGLGDALSCGALVEGDHGLDVVVGEVLVVDGDEQLDEGVLGELGAQVGPELCGDMGHGGLVGLDELIDGGHAQARGAGEGEQAADVAALEFGGAGGVAGAVFEGGALWAARDTEAELLGGGELLAGPAAGGLIGGQAHHAVWAWRRAAAILLALVLGAGGGARGRCVVLGERSAVEERKKREGEAQGVARGEHHGLGGKEGRVWPVCTV